MNKLYGAFSVIIVLIIIGTFTFHKIEGWEHLDAAYFSTMTLTTVGYGDFTPKTNLGKFVTIIYALSGVSVAFYALGIIGTYNHPRIEETINKAYGVIKNGKK